MKTFLIVRYLVLKNLVLRLYYKSPNILTITETIDEVTSKRKSISRFGDGEFMLMFEQSAIGFQDLNSELSKRLSDVFNSNEDNHILAIPDVFGSLNHFVPNSKLFWAGILVKYRALLSELINWEYRYGNSFITRFYIAYNDKDYCTDIVFKLRTIWSNQDLLIVEGKYTRLGVNNDLFSQASSIKRIICPNKNAFSSYSEIVDAVKHHGKEKLILLALGPTATVMAFDLATMGYWALDVGHIDVEYSWFLSRATNKTAISGKHVNESEDSTFNEFPQEILNEYKSSILQEI